MTTERSPHDLTARARIRDAALRLFAERGIGAATIRDIAAAAGVSSGLVRHHFGSKEELRDACDAYAMDETNRMRAEMLQQGRLADAGFMATVHPTVIVLQNYLVRSMLDGSEHAARMFDEMVRLGEEWATAYDADTSDVRAYAAVLVAMQAGVFLLGDHVSRALGDDIRTPSGHARVMRGFVDIFGRALLSPDQVAQIRAGLDRVQNPPPPTGDARESAREGEQR